MESGVSIESDKDGIIRMALWVCGFGKLSKYLIYGSCLVLLYSFSHFNLYLPPPTIDLTREKRRGTREMSEGYTMEKDRL